MENKGSALTFLTRARSLLDETLIARSKGPQMAAGGRLEARLLDLVVLSGPEPLHVGSSQQGRMGSRSLGRLD